MEWMGQKDMVWGSAEVVASNEWKQVCWGSALIPCMCEHVSSVGRFCINIYIFAMFLGLENSVF